MVKNPPANAGNSGDVGLIPGSGRSPGKGNGNPLQYSRQEDPRGRGRSLAGLQSMGLQRVGHNLVIEQAIFIKIDSQQGPTVKQRNYTQYHNNL